MEEISTLQEELRKQKNLMITLQQKMQKNQEAWADTILMCQADVSKVNTGALDKCLYCKNIYYFYFQPDSLFHHILLYAHDRDPNRGRYGFA